MLRGARLSRSTDTWFRARDGVDAYDQFASGYGPTVKLLAAADPATAASFREAFVAQHERSRTDLGVLVRRPYLITAGTRR